MTRIEINNQTSIERGRGRPRLGENPVYDIPDIKRKRHVLGLTLREIADVYGVSRERIRQVLLQHS